MLVCLELVRGVIPGTYHEQTSALRHELGVRIDWSSLLVVMIVAV